MKKLIISAALIIWSVSMASAIEIPAIVLKTSLPIGSDISLAIGTTIDVTVSVDWGNGTRVEYNTGWAAVMVNNTLAGNTIKIYGSTIHYFGAADVIIDTADFSNCPELRYLLMQNCGMSSINIAQNNKLETCYIAKNSLKTLDITNDTSLSELNCDENQLTNLDVSNSKKLYHLSIPSNKFSSIDVTNNTLLSYFDCSNNEFSSIDISKNTLLDFFNCGGNQIVNLDVSQNTELNYLHCYANPLNNLDVSKNIKLTYSDLSFTQLTSIDLSKNTELIQLYCMGNVLTGLDFSNNTKLERVFCENGLLETIVFGENTALKELYCFGNKLSSLDISSLTAIDEFRCNNNQITSLDVSQNNQLIWLYCQSNKLTSITLPANSTFMVLDCRYNLLSNLDLSKSTGLKYFRCIDNKLTSLDLSANDSLFQVKCDSNYLTIATLPLKEDRWTTYLYHPQKNIILSKKQFDTYETIDLKSQVTRAGKSSVFTWKTISGTTLVAGIDYAESTGVFSFLKGQADSVYCEITNETFPLLILETSRFAVLWGSSVAESKIKTSISPNPFTDNFIIESGAAIRQVEIYSITGKKEFELKANGERNITIPAIDLPGGVMILKVKCDEFTSTMKVVKK